MERRDGIVVLALAFVMERLVWVGIAIGAPFALLGFPGARFGVYTLGRGGGRLLHDLVRMPWFPFALLGYVAAVVLVGPMVWNRHRTRGRGQLESIREQSRMRYMQLPPLAIRRAPREESPRERDRGEG